LIRRSGLLVPLFSLRSSRSWGIGEFSDLPVFASWLRAAGQALVQILPITELPETETSPYSALTAMALDPIFITLNDLEDFAAVGGEANLTAADGETLEGLRAKPRIRHREIRALKQRCLRRAFQHFQTSESVRDSARSHRFAAFCHDHRGWLDHYALFKALRLESAGRPWREWPEPLARRVAHALSLARARLGQEIAYQQYVQWIACEQWQAARLAAQPLQVFGDVPFMISGDSPDVWTRQAEFRFDGTVGVPPDAFSATGQDWGLPPWRWEVMAANDFTWMRARAARTAQLFDGFRLDHLVGLYRIYVRPLNHGIAPFFTPADEPTQVRLGEALVRCYLNSAAEIVAEDLGVVPDFVRDSLRRLQLPGCKVFRWEREWSKPSQPFIDPANYPDASMATTGTHDTEPLVIWWQSLSPLDQQQVLAIPTIARRRLTGSAAPESPIDAMVRAVLDARSALTILPLQDVFGWTDRINTPASVNDDNWSWVLPWPVDRWLDHPDLAARAVQLAAWTREAER